jgi:hypothetical protein
MITLHKHERGSVTDKPTKMPGEEGREFFEILGRCIAAWASVDDELFRIFRECVGPHEQSAIIFYRTPGLDARLNLADEIVKSAFPRPDQSNAHPPLGVKAWNALVSKFKDLLHVRRRLAHHPVGQGWPSENGTALVGSSEIGGSMLNEPLYSRLEVDVGEHERARRSSASLKPLTITDLNQHLSSVRALANALNDFLRDVLVPQREELLRIKQEQGR